MHAKRRYWLVLDALSKRMPLLLCQPADSCRCLAAEPAIHQWIAVTLSVATEKQMGGDFFEKRGRNRVTCANSRSFGSLGLEDFHSQKAIAEFDGTLIARIC